MASFIRTGTNLTIVFDDGVSANINTSDSRYPDIRQALNDRDWELARELALPAEQVVRQVQETFNEGPEAVTVEFGVVRYRGKELHGTLADRMVEMLNEGFDISALKLFLINLHENPSYRAVTELYAFLERGKLPITEDGHFLAYKKVRNDYRDVHSGKFDNSVGQVVEMHRNEVDEDSRNECSNGLHFCSRDYLGSFGGQRIMIVKINPADVVAIPADYNMSKGRTCKYVVIGELEEQGKLEGSFRDTRPTPPIPPEASGFAGVDLDDEDEFDDDWDDIDEDELDDEELDDDCGDPTCPWCNPDTDTTGLDVEAANRAIDELHASTIPEEASSFAGIPGDGEPVILPRAVALEIAKASDDELEPVTATGVGTSRRFDDIALAAAATGVRVSDIRRVLRGDRQSTGGYKWSKG